jgi:hypothetical protein
MEGNDKNIDEVTILWKDRCRRRWYRFWEGRYSGLFRGDFLLYIFNNRLPILAQVSKVVAFIWHAVYHYGFLCLFFFSLFFYFSFSFSCIWCNFYRPSCDSSGRIMLQSSLPREKSFFYLSSLPLCTPAGFAYSGIFSVTFRCCFSCSYLAMAEISFPPLFFCLLVLSITPILGH